jgi:hypothetical protein
MYPHKQNIYITDSQDEWIIEQSIILGLSGKSEVIRRVIDREMGIQNEAGKGE